MLQQPAPLMNVLPHEQREVLFQNSLNEHERELLSNRSAMLVKDDALRLIQHLPAAFPREHSEVCIFQVEGTKQVIESAQLEELPAVERAGTAARIEARVSVGNRIIDPMPHAQCSA